MSPKDRRGPKNGREVLNRATWVSLLLTAVLGSLASPLTLAAQVSGASGGFVPGSRELFSADFSQEPLGEFPDSLRNLRGTMAVVEKDGKRMLRASDSAEFLVSLPERLPEHFTLEFDLITRVDYNNEELAFEGTPTFNRGPESANVLWYRTDVSVLGGREAGNAYIKTPPDIAAELEGQPAELRVDVNGSTVTLYTNGRQITSVPDVKFVRGRVLRVFLGGHDTELNAVHLSRVRIADASTAGPIVVQPQSGLPGGPAATRTAPTNAVLQRASTGPGTQTEDDLYVGTKRQVEGVTGPLTSTPQVPSGAGTSPNTGRTTALSGGNEGDLDDLEVERLTVEGVTGPLTSTPQIPSGAGTSPNTGAAPEPGVTVSPEPAKPLPN